MLKKKIWANFQRITELFTQKIVTKLLKIWVRIRDEGSEIGDQKKPIPDPGSRGQKGTGAGSGSATLVNGMHVQAKANRSNVNSEFFQPMTAANNGICLVYSVYNP
jgi:hypothetical protein